MTHDLAAARKNARTDADAAAIAWAQDEIERYREAALVAFGALAVRNESGKADDVLATLSKYLFPTLSQPSTETTN